MTSISPAIGPMSGGTFGNPNGTVAIAGTNFKAPMNVAFGATNATNIRVISTDLILAAPPPSSSNEGVFVRVTTGGGTSTTTCAASVLGQPVIQTRCNDSFFYMTTTSFNAPISLDFLNGLDLPVTPTSGADGAPSGIVHECGYRTPPKPGMTTTGSVQVSVPDPGTTVTGTANLNSAQNALLPSAFTTSAIFVLNHPITFKFALSIAYGDCIDVPIATIGIAGLYVVLEPQISGSVSYAVTMEPGIYAISGGGWVNGALQAPSIGLVCSTGVNCFQKSAPPSWNIQASLIAGPMFRLGPSLSSLGAYIEAGPAVGLAVGTGSGGSFAETCFGGVWDGHVNLSVFGYGIDIGAANVILGPYQIAGTGTTPDQHCPLG